MILTKVRKETATGFVENNPQTKEANRLPTEMRKRILNSVVRLKGTNTKNEVFNGSGVIINAKTVDNNKYKVIILTALHNVSVWGGKDAPDIPDKDTIKAFTDKVKVWYGKNDLLFNSDPNGSAAVTPGTQIGNLCGERKDCYYDLLVLESADKALFTFAKESVFGNKEDTIIQEAKEFPAKFEHLLNRRRFVYVQLGFGKGVDARPQYSLANDGKVVGKKKQVNNKEVLDELPAKAELDTGKMSDYHLHYRLTLPLSQEKSESAYDLKPKEGQSPTYLEYVKPILITGTKISTTAKGDSGGPLYAINRVIEKIGDNEYKKFTKAYLMGVTSGADMQVAKKISPLYINCVSTSVAPYFASLKA